MDKILKFVKDSEDFIDKNNIDYFLLGNYYYFVDMINSNNFKLDEDLYRATIQVIDNLAFDYNKNFYDFAYSFITFFYNEKNIDNKKLRKFLYPKDKKEEEESLELLDEIILFCE